MEKQALAGRYALGERVGAGGMADVFTARDTRLERNVAVKLFRPGTADGLERGSAEARLLARLDHPGLVRVLDMDTGEHAGDGAYLVMELVEGPDLGVLLRTTGPLGREGMRQMALDLARTLQYIHGRGIVHRDLKPSNILTRDVDPHSGLFRYLLTDFGIARFFDGGQLTATGQVIGSAAYFSPEQARGDRVGQPSDIYSLGLVLIEALTGERAFPGTGIESALARLHRSPSIPHAAGPALSALLVSMTLDGPADRPDAAGVLHALTAMGPQFAPGADTTSVAPPAEVPTAALPLPRPEELSDDRSVSDGAAPPARPTHAGAMALERGHPGASADPGDGTDRGADGSPSDRRSGTIGSRGGTPLMLPDQQSPAAEVNHPAPGKGPSGRAGTVQDRRPVPRRAGRRSALPWVLGLLVVVLAAAGAWIFLSTTTNDSAPVIEPLPAVSGAPGERLQELYESVQP